MQPQAVRQHPRRAVVGGGDADHDRLRRRRAPDGRRQDGRLRGHGERHPGAGADDRYPRDRLRRGGAPARVSARLGPGDAGADVRRAGHRHAVGDRRASCACATIRRASSWCAATSRAIRCSSSPRARSRCGCRAARLRWARAASSARWRCSTACRAAPRSSPPSRPPCWCSMPATSTRSPRNIPSLVEAVEREARRRRAENQGDRGAERERRHTRHWPGPSLGPFGYIAAVTRPLPKAFDHVAHHARHPGRRLRQAPVAAVAREHAQAVRAAARQAVDLPADPAARRRPQPVRHGR